MPQPAFSLFQLQDFIRRIIALNLPEAVWIRAEIGQVKPSRGHVYLDLVEKGAESTEWIAQAPAVIWSSTMRQLRKQLGSSLASLLQQGMEILIKARVEYHERFGLKLIIEEIDPAYTVGQLALAQLEKRNQIQAEGLLGKNAAIPLPYAIQRIAVISAEQAAGWQDFQKQLSENPYGYAFRYRLYPAAMQGASLEGEILEQLHRIQQRQGQYDAVAILRGGGSRLDLAGFDSVPLCRAIAHFPLPVFTGIGHDIDETLVDLVAHTSLKTPTALAAFFVQHNMDFESQLLEWAAQLKLESNLLILGQRQRLEQQQQVLKTHPRNQLVLETTKLKQIEETLPIYTRYALREATQLLDSAQQICNLLSIEHTLKRGFSITYLNGKPIDSIQVTNPGDQLTTQLADGTVVSTIK